MCRMSLVPAIVILGHSMMHNSLSDCGSITPKIKCAVNKHFTFKTLLRVSDVNLDNRHVRAK